MNESALPERSPVSGLPHREEQVSCWIQRAGFLLSVAAASVLIALTGVFGSAAQIVAGSIYGASLILLYLVSAWYHGTRHPGRKHVLKVLDHASIYLLIAGTYTPFTLVTLNGGWGWSLFGVVWGLAILGILWKLWFVHRFEFVSTLIYLAMGWIGVIAIVPLIELLPMGGFVWLMLGGAAYSLGSLFFLWSRLPYHHVVWHGFVLLGVACHYGAIFGYVLGPNGA
jgi:hemolysin III